MAKLLYIYGTSSITHGHDKISNQLPLRDGDHVFSFQRDGDLVQNPGEPVGGGGGRLGSSPIRYFADEMAFRCKDDDIAVAGVNIVHHTSWHDGIHMWNKASAVATLKHIQPLLDDGWRLAGIIVGSDGNFDSDHEIRAFGHDFHAAMETWRKVFGIKHLPAFLMQSGDLQPNNMQHESEMRLREFRKAEAHIGMFDHDAICIESSPGLGNMPNSSLHFNAHGAHDFGHDIGDAVFHYTSVHHPDWLV